MTRKQVLLEMRGTLAGAVLLVMLALWVMPSLAGGGEQAQFAVPQSVTDRAWNLVTDEAITMALLTAAGILSAIGLVGAVRLVKRKPRRADYGQDEGFAYQTAYDDWQNFLAMVATYGGMVWIFALNMIFLEDRYGWAAKIVVALTPSMIGGFLVRPAYNWIRKKGQAMGLIAKPPKGEADSDGLSDDDVTRL